MSVVFMILTKTGHEVICDKDDEALISKLSLSVNFRNSGGNKVVVSVVGYRLGDSRPLTHFLMEVPKGMVVDHINGDPLDNRRSNLRICTVAQNIYNSRKRVISSNSLKGVQYRRDKPRTKPWRASITVNGKKISLGHFETIEQAHQAYSSAAIKHRGEYARV